MGSTRKPKKQYSVPLQLWNKDRLDEERPLVKEFGLKNKRELWKTKTLLRKYARQAKFLIASRGNQAEMEKKQLIGKLAELGILNSESSLDDVLGLTVKDFLGRRLQTIVFKRNLSKSINQSRQFITHRHIKAGNKMMTSPSYLVPLKTEDKVFFVENSSLVGRHQEEEAERKMKEGPENKEEKTPKETKTKQKIKENPKNEQKTPKETKTKQKIKENPKNEQKTPKETKTKQKIKEGPKNDNERKTG